MVLLVGLASGLTAGPSQAAPARPQGDDADRAPAARYARLDRVACEAELTRRRIPFARVPEARGVLAPVRLTGPVHGVRYHTELPPKQRPASPYEIFDCRLVLALDDFGAVLEPLGVVEVVHFSAYRPPLARAWPSGKVGARHLGGLAIDASRLVKRDGSTLDVLRDFHGRIGAETCGDGAARPDPATPEALALRKVVCDAASARLFHVILTPHNDWAHRNHLHLEVTSGVRWFIVK